MQKTQETQKMSTQQTNMKNYYQILEVNQNATLNDIQKAYQRLSLRWHPDKHTADRKLAEKKFHQISQAFDVLSDPNKRSTYDNMLNKQYSLETAYKIFDQFFGQNQMFDQQEQKFFQKNYPQRRKNYYHVLGVKKDSTQDQIDKAYRKMALKHHPRNNPNNEQATKKFVQINQAYQTLSNRNKRSTYNSLMFPQIIPGRSFDIFQNFFQDRWMDIPNQMDLLKPIFERRPKSLMKWPNVFDMSNQKGLMGRTDSQLDSIKEGESYHREEMYEKKNGRERHTAQTIKRKVNNGVLEEETLKENIMPNGERDVIRTVKKGDKVDTKTYHLKSGEQMPMQIMNQ